MMTPIEALKQEREALRGGKRKRGRPPRPFYPKPAESFYERRLREMINYLIQLSEDILVSRVPVLQNEVKATRGDSVKNDVLTPQQISGIMGQIVIEFNRRYSQRTIEQLVQETASKTIAFNRQQAEKQVGSFIGREFTFGVEPYLTQENLLFQAFNVNLIQSIPDQFKTRLTNELLSSLQAGRPAGEIIKQIRNTYPVTQNRARLIAYDQIGKFNGALDKTRFEQLGVEKYVWNTQEDGRVRPAHAALNGKVRSWEQSPIPGEEINCRCFATAYFEGA